MALTKSGRNVLVVLGIVALAFGLRTAAKKGIGKSFVPAFLVSKVDLGTEGNLNMTGSAKEFAGVPSATPASGISGPLVKVKWWAWNAQFACNYANGGPTTTKNSLMAKHGVSMQIERQDDNSQLQAELTSLAKDLKDNEKTPGYESTKGTQFVGIMGDGAGAFLTPLNEQLTKAFGPDYRAEVVGSCGYSRGEDKLMGPEEWKSNPQSMKGALIAGVLRDGDWNIAMRYAGDNGVANNPDETTYDPNAINWVNPKDYMDASQKLIQGYCEDRKVVNNGKPTGATKHVCVQGVVTWTPGDVIVAKNLGGVVNIISTAPGEYENQMPHVIIGIHKWNQTHRSTVEKMLTAFAEAGDQILTYPDKTLDKAGDVSQEIYKEKGADGEYWKKYYQGVTEKDKLGKPIHLGGSKVNNLADELDVFGLADGSNTQNSKFHATYNSFGNLSAKMYPKLMPHLAPEDSILDLSYLQAVKVSVGAANVGTVAATTYSNTDTVSKVIGRRNVSIEFATGQSTFTPLGLEQVERLRQELTISKLRIVVHGHTDNTGSPTANEALSEARALAVKKALEKDNEANFPTGRVTVRAHGSADPIASNATEAGRSKNRRVEIVIGQ